VPTGVAFTTGYLWHKCDLVTNGHMLDLIANRSDHTADLVPLYHRVAGVGMDAMINVNVRSTYADAQGAHQDFIRTRRGLVYAVELNDARLGHNCLFHWILPSHEK